MRLSSLLQEGRNLLVKAQCESARLDADLLLMQILKCQRTYLITHDNEELSEDTCSNYLQLIKRRCQGEPVAYILGEKEFWGLTLKVSNSVLVPRPDTELIVETALSFVNAQSVLDLGTGSGAIILALKHTKPTLEAYAADISDKALDIAKENAHTLKLNINFIKSSWFSDIPKRSFDLIVSNPPYIEDNDPHLLNLSYEPINALVSGKDGLDDIRIIAKDAPRFLNAGGALLLEHGYNQGQRVRDILEENGFSRVKTLQDFGAQDRVTYGIFKNKHSRE